MSAALASRAAPGCAAPATCQAACHMSARFPPVSSSSAAFAPRAAYLTAAESSVSRLVTTPVFAAPQRCIARARHGPAPIQAGFKGFGAPKPKPKKEDDCPCGSGQGYAACCGRLHGGEPAASAEQLMRSRYTAYVRADPDYIVATTHPDNPAFAGTRKPDGTLSSTLRQDAAATAESLKFERLEILSAEDGSGPDEAYVTFRAHFRLRGQDGQRQKGSVKQQSFVERSRFLREDGRWLYVNGEQDWHDK